MSGGRAGLSIGYMNVVQTDFAHQRLILSWRQARRLPAPAQGHEASISLRSCQGVRLTVVVLGWPLPQETGFIRRHGGKIGYKLPRSLNGSFDFRTFSKGAVSELQNWSGLETGHSLNFRILAQTTPHPERVPHGSILDTLFSLSRSQPVSGPATGS